MIREAQTKDGAGIAELLSLFGDEIYDISGGVINRDKELIRELFEKNLNRKFRIKLYEESGEIIGFIAFYDSFSLYAKGSFITVSELYVKKGYRSKGVGKKLLGSIIALAKEKNCPIIELTTPPLPEFQRSLDFYLKNGFEVTGGRKVKYGF